MRAWVVDHPGPIATGPLRSVERPEPRRARGRCGSACGRAGCAARTCTWPKATCRRGVRRPCPATRSSGRSTPSAPGATRFALGDRIGIAWLRGTCGRCRWCRSGRENLCPDARFTGWDADGGYAEYAVVPEAFAYRLPAALGDGEAAPLLCAGIVGYRALQRAELPPGGRLGIYGFGASAHVVAQVALAQGATVHVLTRSAQARELALQLGAASAGPADAAPPEPLDAAMLFAPAGELVPVALRALDQGGTLAVAGIHLTDVPGLNYADELFREKQLRSVTANTRADGEEFLRLAAALARPADGRPPPARRGGRALADLAADRITGAAVLMV